jgi:hypothetical protein
VLGSIQLCKIEETISAQKGCFKVINKEDLYWLICSSDGTYPYNFKCAVDTALGRKCDLRESLNNSLKLMTIIQPQIIVPIASPDCKFDWDYAFHGQNWVCNCNEGLEQSPVDLPASGGLETLRYGAQFDYKAVSASNLKMVYDINLLRIRVNEGYSFGSI